MDAKDLNPLLEPTGPKYLGTTLEGYKLMTSNDLVN